MNCAFKDQRKISGNRVIAECEVLLPNSDPFAHYNNLKAGYIVFNVRGGGLYLTEHFNSGNIHKVFPNWQTTTFETLKLSVQNDQDIVIRGLKVTFVRLKKEPNREGIIVRFMDISEEQLDLLLLAQHLLPAIGSNEGASVPFDEIITMNRVHYQEDNCRFIPVLG